MSVLPGPENDDFWDLWRQLVVIAWTLWLVMVAVVLCLWAYEGIAASDHGASHDCGNGYVACPVGGSPTATG